jgi:hypothetical protein
LLELEEYMWRYEQGHTLQQFGLPQPTARSSQRGNRALGALLRLNSRDLGEYVQQHLPLLNDGQRDAFDQVVRALNANQVRPPPSPSRASVLPPAQLDHSAVPPPQGGVFFLDGPGGTGKTFVYKLLLAHVRSEQAVRPLDEQRVALAVASSGLAATLLPGGTTAHSRFKIPIPVNRDSTCG